MSQSERPVLMPYDSPDYMAPAWVACLLWSSKQANILEAFSADTGFVYPSARTALDRQIDKACGIDEAFAERFIAWFNQNVWGPIGGATE